LVIGLGDPLASADEPSLRTLSGRHVQILTDLPSSAAVDELPAAFDAAVPYWADVLQLPADAVAAWQVRAYVMQDKASFRARGYLPSDLPDFPHGFQRGDQLWVIAQPGEYYTRHLLLHEGVHALMEQQFGGAGAPWFMEGTAELWATHAWDGRQIRLPIIPASRSDTPYWGRLRLIDEGRRRGSIPSFQRVMEYSRTAHREVEAYAWCWAALTLLEMYPEYRPLIAQRARDGGLTDDRFNRMFRETTAMDWSLLESRWRLLVADLDYGFDPERNRWSPVEDRAPLSDAGVERSIDVDRGWQATGIWLEPGQAIELTATGRYQLADDPGPWWSEPDGVTLRYHRGRPLGRLLAMVLPEPESAPPPSGGRGEARGRAPDAIDGWQPDLKWVDVGSHGRLEAETAGQLLLKINDLPGGWADNRGQLHVKIRPEPPAARP
jgi:hypothetical protein